MQARCTECRYFTGNQKRCMVSPRRQPVYQSAMPRNCIAFQSQSDADYLVDERAGLVQSPHYAAEFSEPEELAAPVRHAEPEPEPVPEPDPEPMPSSSLVYPPDFNAPDPEGQAEQEAAPALPEWISDISARAQSWSVASMTDDGSIEFFTMVFPDPVVAHKAMIEAARHWHDFTLKAAATHPGQANSAGRNHLTQEYAQ